MDLLPHARSARRVGAVGAVVDQFIVAGTSFILMLLVRRLIGRGALGEYAWLINAMILLTALQTAWVGDSLTVLDRMSQRVRAGLSASMLTFFAVAFVASALIARGMVSTWNALLFGLMVAAWIAEEVGRRIFMVRQEFWKLVLNDAIYAVSALLAIVVLQRSAEKLTLEHVVLSMLVGAVASVAAAWFQLPRAERSWPAPSWSAAKELAAFAGWRSAQMGIRPLAQFAVRTLVIVSVSKTAAGDLESARLFSQPAMTYVSGVASFLLPMYTRQEATKSRGPGLMKMTLLLVLPVVVYGAVILAVRGSLARRLFDDHTMISKVAILGWLATALMFAAGQPVANVLIARRQSRALFWVRAADSFIGLIVAAIVIETASANYAPWALAAGMVVGTFGLVVIVRKATPPTEGNGDVLRATRPGSIEDSAGVNKDVVLS